MSEVIRFSARVTRVEAREEIDPLRTTGFGDNVVKQFRSAGWFITFDIGLTLGVGESKPELKPGDSVRLTIEKV